MCESSWCLCCLVVSLSCRCLLWLCVSELDKEDSCGEMSVPSSPQNEAIQHSSISTSNGVSSSTAATAALASGPALGPTADHSTEEEESPQVGGASSSHTQSSGSWSGLWLVTLIPGSHEGDTKCFLEYSGLVSPLYSFELFLIQRIFTKSEYSSRESPREVTQKLYRLFYGFFHSRCIYWVKGSRRSDSRQPKSVRIHSERKRTYWSTIRGVKIEQLATLISLPLYFAHEESEVFFLLLF